MNPYVLGGYNPPHQRKDNGCQSEESSDQFVVANAHASAAYLLGTYLL